MRTVGNILWVLFAGIWLALAYAIAGIVNFIFIITIPFGIQCFKLAGFSLWPFGRTVIDTPGSASGVGCIANGLWFVVSGVWLAVAHLLAGVVLCITIIGIPFGIQCFKLAGLALWPFGKTIVPNAVAQGEGVAVQPLGR